MSVSVKIQLDLPLDQAIVFRDMARRCRGTVLVDSESADPASMEDVGLITSRAPAAADAVKQGRPTLLIDPLAVGRHIGNVPNDAERLMPGLESRFKPSMVSLKQAIQAGKVGEPGLLRSHRWGGSIQNPIDRLAEQVDLALWLLEGIPSEIYAVRRDRYWQVHLGFDTGAMALIDVDATASMEQPWQPYDSVHVIGSKGAVYADDHRNINLKYGSGETNAIHVNEGHAAIAGMIDQFASCLRQRGPFVTTWSDMLRVNAIIDEIQHSAQTGQVTVDGDGDE